MNIELPTPQKPIAVKTLIKRLCALHTTLADMPDDPSPSELDPVRQTAKKLVHRLLLHHQDLGVQAHTVACIAQVLRLCVPEAPYSASELTSFFSVLISSIIPHLSELPDLGTLYATHRAVHVSALVRLASDSLFSLVARLPKADKLAESLFKTCFERLARSQHFDQNLTRVLGEILASVVAEVPFMSQGLLKIIIWSLQDETPDKSSGKPPVAFSFAHAITEGNPERMERQIAQFFSEQLYENSVEKTGKTAATNLEQLHKLVSSIWRTVPETIAPVVALVDAELDADSEKVRILALSTVAAMTIVQPAKISLTSEHPETFSSWCAGAFDLLASARAVWANSACEVLEARVDLAEKVSNGFVKSLVDSDEKVRLSAVLGFEKHLLKAIFSPKFAHNLTILKTLGLLCREKHAEIRESAVRTLCGLYRDNYEEIYLEYSENESEPEDGDDDVSTSMTQLLGWVPDLILGLLYINDPAINSLVDRVLVEDIFGLEEDNYKRALRLVHIVSTLLQRSKTAFWALCLRQPILADGARKYASLLEKSSSELEGLENVKKVVLWLSSGQPDPKKAAAIFARTLRFDSRKRLCHLLKLCIGHGSGIDTIRGSFQEFFSKLEEPKSLTSVKKPAPELEKDWGTQELEISQNDVLSAWKTVLYRCSLVYFNRGNIEHFMALRAGKLGETASEIVEHASEDAPKVFEYQIDELVKVIIDAGQALKHHEEQRKMASIEKSDTSTPQKSQTRRLTGFGYVKSTEYSFLSDDTESNKENESEAKSTGTPKGSPRMSTQASLTPTRQGGSDLSEKPSTFADSPSLVPPLKTAYAFFAKYPKYLPKHNSAFREALVTFSLCGTPLEAKFAIRTLSLGKSSYTDLVVASIIPLNRESLHFCAHLSVLSELFLAGSKTVVAESAHVTDYVIKEILVQNHATEAYDDWILDEDLEKGLYDTCYAKILALRVFMNRVRAGANTDLENMVLKLLVSCIGNGGELASNAKECPTPAAYAARLRLAAGLCLLKIGQNTILKPSTINILVFLIQDENVEVRERFLEALQSFLSKLNPRFLPLVFFAAHEPEAKLKARCRTWIRSLYRAIQAADQEDISFELAFVRMLHMIAHHQEFLELVCEPNDDTSVLKGYVFALKYIVFFLSNVATKENVSLLFYLSTRIKQYRDAFFLDIEYDAAERPKSIDNIYKLGDLAVLAVKTYSSRRHWALQTFPGKLQLTKDLFSPMHSSDEARHVAETSYVPDELVGKLQTFVRSEMSTKRPGGGNTKRKRPQNRRRKRVKVVDRGAVRRSARNVKKVDYEESGQSDSGESDEESDSEID